MSSDLAGGADTIIARATPAGRAALAMIRVSGPLAAACAAKVCGGLAFADGWRVSLAELFGAHGEHLDRGVAITFPAPRSYTGEDMLEISVHGSPFLVEAVVESFVAAGARPAEAGEFTRRAVANGKLDLVQAEAVRDMVAADTALQHRIAREQLAGSLSRELGALRSSFVNALAMVEASLDYGAQGVTVSAKEISTHLADCRNRLAVLLATARAGARIRDGLRVVILGPPNVGKSTLFNQLCGSERAIVSPRPGTTRDLIEAELDIGGVPVVLQDTAGLRSTGDEIEVEGHRRAEAAAAAADLALVLWSMGSGGSSSPPVVGEGLPTINVRSKADLEPGGAAAEGWLRLSCHSGEGLSELRDALAERVRGDVPDLGGATAIGSRHFRALESAEAELRKCDPMSPETSAESLRWAVRSVDQLVGEIVPDDVLDRVFSAFCIGK